MELIKRSPTSAPESGSTFAPYATSEMPRVPVIEREAGGAGGGGKGFSSGLSGASWSRARSLTGRSDLRLWGLAISVAILLLVLALWLGHRIGRATGFKDWSTTQGEDSTLSGGAPAGGAEGSRSGGAGTAAAGSGDAPTPVRAPVVPAVPVAAAQVAGGEAEAFRSGYNYLVVATLPYQEGTVVGRYLAEKNLPAQLIPRGKVDLEQAAAKNALCEVVVLRGFAPDEFGARAKERDELMTRVKRLGRLWRAENKRAPSDFSDAWWKKY